MMQTPHVQTVRTPAVGDLEIDIELDPDTDAEIEAILEGLTEDAPAAVQRTDRYRCVPVRRR